MATMSTSTVCCPKFDVKAWGEKTHVWKDKLFVTDNVVQIFHIPLNFSQVLTRLLNKVKTAKAEVDMKDFLLLAYDPSPWKSEIYMNITKEVPHAKNIKLSGTFVSKVYDGPFNAVPKFIQDMDAYLKKQNQKSLKYYFYYTTCPKCAKKYGHNYIVAFAQIK